MRLFDIECYPGCFTVLKDFPEYGGYQVVLPTDESFPTRNTTYLRKKVVRVTMDNLWDEKDFREKVIMPVSEFWVTFAPYTESDGTVWQVYAVDPSKGIGRTSV